MPRVLTDHKVNPTGAPEHDIEITPEMIEAGVEILVEMYDALGSGLDRTTTARIFKAMLAKRAARPSDQS